MAERSYYEADARERIDGLLDAGSFTEFVGPRRRLISAHLAQLDTPGAFDDGIVVGEGRLRGRHVLIAAQQGAFMGGGVGEVHGAKLTGLLERAAATTPDAVVLLLDTGGVRLHEANAGLIAISEIMRATLGARAAGVPVLALIGSGNGAFGGMGIVARCCSAVIMSEEGRLSLSGPDVIETVRGVEEFDARDRALVWRVTGGKHRYLIGDAQTLVPDRIAAFADAAATTLDTLAEPQGDAALQALEREHHALAARITAYGDCRDGVEIWRRQGIADPERLPLLDTDAFLAATADRSTP
ncbi:biotin-independent malonate decarboxylase subunit beta [Xanthomonas campestris pv. campestris]|uniref:biotin-independent malonate decarboxylase subunit beta n=1 Tax=Xanthomonas campestris TaxID=339 RepID=UPI0015629F18|nr:biotin-independent malonate decarboxylase subunit beta [Xanthomonas campestris]MCD0248524.1 biotin-independent malonate decarboxylase subunit beta [Xanthomonas campestris pv. campestris]MCD0260924.1 biotin-independent malonate decarboxylase subunit beta [Xanthomonas campestris pv. campestris]MCD0269546.1 biotin-independent malonate decarboxylase subunit beta [Xanthomonas campestris pv. campestris]MDO0829750.1 biotin-independent malonate decarboxylase subunit beta [Xanthomonas campestris pv. 